jgi:hypothetical protein
MKHIQKILVTFSIIIAGSNVLPAQLPYFYRAQPFQDVLEHASQPWATTLGVTGGHATAHDSFDGKGNKVPLFSLHGPMNLASMGSGLNNTDSSKENTKTWYGTGSPFATPATLVINPLDTHIDIAGKLQASEINLFAEQGLPWGIFAKINVPLKRLALKELKAKNKGLPIVQGVDIDQAIQAGGLLSQIAQEQGLIYSYDDYTKSGVGDATVSLGWHGSTDGVMPLFELLRGYLLGGAVVPTSAKQDINRVFDIPLGFNNHFGFYGRGGAELTIFSLLNLGFNAGATIFLPNDRVMRLVSGSNQTGPMMLVRANASEDLGSVWDVGAYARWDSKLTGISLLFGYSLTKQETTTLHVKDSLYLHDAQTAAIAALTASVNTLGGRTTLNVFNEDRVANSASVCHGFEMQTLHIKAAFDTRKVLKGNYGAIVSVSYDYPVAGKRVMVGPMLSGSGAIQVKLDF